MTPAAYAALKSRATGLSAPIYWSNDNADTPDTATATIWVSASIMGAGAEIRALGSIGDHEIRDHGALRFHILVPRGTGSTAALTLYAELADLYRVVNFSGIQTYAPTPIDDSGGADDGSWLAFSFSVPFTFDYQG